MSTTRLSAEERREQLLEAAMGLVAQRGFDATPTLAIAKAAGISHAYLFRLFPSKEDLAVALVARCNARIQERFDHAASTALARGEDPFAAMGAAYVELLAERDVILVQLHAYAASPTHPEIRTAMRASFRDLVELVQRTTGAPDEEVSGFFAQGMLMNVTAALDLHEVDEPFARTLTEKHGGDDPACIRPPHPET
ncbi:TetR/AcrR family transcriptional regulator [Patulibacter sp.]|uniref:TetR/AcrR family transcriptional regulator n=1 Tax=Patulibacter sp. TaxID=1912859 RepID=UPI002723EA1B|nr:TetR/AcrR family transcriptional regulator [Patulibacter sp.]MDO9407622.1 TetR/AcrR family transcriptional regulator [Patulibacter sp.]